MREAVERFRRRTRCKVLHARYKQPRPEQLRQRAVQRSDLGVGEASDPEARPAPVHQPRVKHAGRDAQPHNMPEMISLAIDQQEPVTRRDAVDHLMEVVEIVVGRQQCGRGAHHAARLARRGLPQEAVQDWPVAHRDRLFILVNMTIYKSHSHIINSPNERRATIANPTLSSAKGAFPGRHTPASDRVLRSDRRGNFCRDVRRCHAFSTERKTMRASSVLATIGGTPHIRVARLFPDSEVWIKSERVEPRRLDQGPHRAGDGRGRRERRPAQARRHDHRADSAAIPASASRWSPR